jgi:hypothetical protein
MFVAQGVPRDGMPAAAPAAAAPKTRTAPWFLEGVAICPATSCAADSGRFVLPGVGTPVDETGDLAVVYDASTRFDDGLDGTLRDGLRVVVEGPGYWDGQPVSGDWT